MGSSDKAEKKAKAEQALLEAKKAALLQATPDADALARDTARLLSEVSSTPLEPAKPAKCDLSICIPALATMPAKSPRSHRRE